MRIRGQSRSVVLVFGENASDIEAIRHLLVALRPELAGRTQPRREPMMLVKNVAPQKLVAAHERLRRVIDAEAGEVAAVFAHEDADDVEPAHEPLATSKERAFRRAGVPFHAVVPAWEIEAWWMLWPEAAPLVNRRWQAPIEFRGRSTGKVPHAKEALEKALVKHLDARGRREARPYAEADGIEIARIVKERSWARGPAGKNASYERFVASADAIAL